jgi:enoyl-CoA hydratase/carnithine racemase
MSKVLFEARDGIAIVTINRPERLNACDFETYGLLADAWTRFRDDPELRVAILTGSGDRAFCAGSDIKSNYAENRAAEEPVNRLFPVLATMTKPIIAAIHGHCNGGGLEQALACDMRVASTNAQFGLGEVRLGLLPGGGGTQRLPRLIPLGRALELLYTGSRIGAEEAWRLGLVDHLVPPERVLAKSLEIAGEICKSAPLAVEKIREAALGGLDLTLEEGLALEARNFLFLRDTEDSVEGAQAFAEKRTPVWRGR